MDGQQNIKHNYVSVQ